MILSNLPFIHHLVYSSPLANYVSVKRRETIKAIFSIFEKILREFKDQTAGSEKILTAEY